MKYISNISHKETLTFVHTLLITLSCENENIAFIYDWVD